MEQPCIYVLSVVEYRKKHGVLMVGPMGPTLGPRDRG
jgi:hypothetical protein